MNMADIRMHSEAVAKELGYMTNTALPPIEVPRERRSADDVLDRFFVLYCVAACAYGFDRTLAFAWLKRESKQVRLSQDEARFLREGSGDKQRFILQIEGMWALAWYLGVTETLEFHESCPADFVKRLPDLKKDETTLLFRARAKPRSLEALLQKCDLAYCLHWAIRSAELSSRRVPGRVKPYVIAERRHALEWLITSDEWDDVPMDT